jgi:hypothetical protein
MGLGDSIPRRPRRAASGEAEPTRSHCATQSLKIGSALEKGEGNSVIISAYPRHPRSRPENPIHSISSMPASSSKRRKGRKQLGDLPWESRLPKGAKRPTFPAQVRTGLGRPVFVAQCGNVRRSPCYTVPSIAHCTVNTVWMPLRTRARAELLGMASHAWHPVTVHPSIMARALLGWTGPGRVRPAKVPQESRFCAGMQRESWERLGKLK